MVQMYMRDLKKVSALWSVRFGEILLQGIPQQFVRDKIFCPSQRGVRFRGCPLQGGSTVYVCMQGLILLWLSHCLRQFQCIFASLSFFWFFMPFSQQFWSYCRFSIFHHLLHTLFAFLGNVVQQAMVCRRRQKGRRISVIYTLFQRTFRGI